MNKIIRDDYEKFGFRNTSMKEFVFVLFLMDDSQIDFIGSDGDQYVLFGPLAKFDQVQTELLPKPTFFGPGGPENRYIRIKLE